MGNRRYTREFSYTRPIMYQGEWYPSADAVVSDGKGNERKGRMFADSNGNYFTLDENGNALSAMPVVNQQEEVVVIAPNLLSKRFNDYLRASNDATMVGNVSHRKYNTHLTENVLSGAKAHATWDKEHPNLSAWRDAATAVPLAVAAAPVVVGAGEAALGTAAGQTARNGLAALMGNPIVDAANTALGLGFAGKGAYDVSQGEFTPSTALDFLGLYPVSKSLTGLTNPRKTNSLKNSLVDMSNSPLEGEVPFRGYKQDPLEMHFARARAKGYDPSNIQIHNLSENTEANAEFINSLAKQYDMKPKEVLDFLMNHLNRHGHGAAFPGTNHIIHDGRLENPNEILSHEVDHILHIPDELLPEGMFLPRIKNLYKDEFFKQNNTEVAARGSQLHDYYGHTGTEPLTKEELEYARDHYSRDTGIFNNMTDLLQSTTDLDGLAKWMTKYSTGIVPLGLVGASQSQQK